MTHQKHIYAHSSHINLRFCSISYLYLFCTDRCCCFCGPLFGSFVANNGFRVFLCLSSGIKGVNNATHPSNHPYTCVWSIPPNFSCTRSTALPSRPYMYSFMHQYAYTAAFQKLVSFNAFSYPVARTSVVCIIRILWVFGLVLSIINLN